MSIKRMDHVGVVVDDLEAAVAFFVELGWNGWAARAGRGRVGGPGRRARGRPRRHRLRGDPRRHSRLELTQFHRPAATTAEPSAPANTQGLRRLMFAVDDIHDIVTRLKAHGGELVGEVAPYEDVFRLCYLRGPGGIIVALAEEVR